MSAADLSGERGEVVLGGNHDIARNADDSFIRTTTRSCGQSVAASSGDVDADDGNVAIREFPEIWAAVESDGLAVVGMRIRTEAAMEVHERHCAYRHNAVKHYLRYSKRVSPAERRQQIILNIVGALRSERLRVGRSQNDVAHAAGLSHTMVMRVEKLERLPTIDTLLRIAEALDLDLGAVIGKASEPFRKK